MPREADLTSHPIAYVSLRREDGSSAHRSEVLCPRRMQSVSANTCARCPHFATIAANDQGAGVEVVRCFAPAAESLSADAGSTQLPRALVTEIMTRNIACVPPDLSLDAASALFLESGLRSLPVVDAQGNLMGFLNESDLILEVQLGEARRGPEAQPVIVADVMCADPLTLPETATITVAAAVMAYERQDRLAVIAESGRVIGIVSASDVMSWLASADGHTLPRSRPR